MIKQTKFFVLTLVAIVLTAVGCGNFGKQSKTVKIANGNVQITFPGKPRRIEDNPGNRIIYKFEGPKLRFEVYWKPSKWDESKTSSEAAKASRDSWIKANTGLGEIVSDQTIPVDGWQVREIHCKQKTNSVGYRKGKRFGTYQFRVEDSSGTAIFVGIESKTQEDLESHEVREFFDSIVRTEN